MDRSGNTRLQLDDPRLRKPNRLPQEISPLPDAISSGEGSVSRVLLARRKSFSILTQVSERAEEDPVRRSRRSNTQPACRTLQDLVKDVGQSEDGLLETSDMQASEHLRSPSPMPDPFDSDLRLRLSELAAHQELHPNMEALLNKSAPDEADTGSPHRRNQRASSRGSSCSNSSSPDRQAPDSPRSQKSTRRARFGAKPGSQDDEPISPAPSRRPSLGQSHLSLQLPSHQDLADNHSECSAHTPAGSTSNSRRPSRILDAIELAHAVDVHAVLKVEKDRDATQVSSRAYNDEDHFTPKTQKLLNGSTTSMKLQQLCEPWGTKPGRTMKTLQRALEMGEATIVVTWFLTVVISVVIALQCAGLLVLSRSLQTWRLHIVEVAISEWSSEWLAFSALLAYALLSTLVASCLVCQAPRAQGSGIPDLKAFLNGNHIPQLFSFRTWLVRGLGLILVTSAGLSAGTEGPCGHLGAIASRGLAKATFTLFGGSLPTFGHRSCCEFVAMGCAVGVAAAFSAPVGGILFAMEEASSFWNKGLTVRSFVASMIAAAVVKAAKAGFRELPSSGFIEFPDPTAGFDMGELLPFFVIAVGTSLLGAFFCACVQHLTRLRLRFYQHFTRRRKHIVQVLEALSVATITMGVCFWVPLAFGCSRLSEKSAESTWFVGKQARTVCREGHYSDIGTLLLERKETAIKALFTASFEGNAEFDTAHLFFCAAIVFVTTILTYGTALPVGLFVPNILVGACFGRGIGQIWASLGFASHPGVHALMGSAGMLAGFGRMAVSLTMIILEITNSTRLLLPVMLCILISKALADRFTESVYDVSINYHSLRDISVIKGELDDEDMPLLRYLTVHDACSVFVQTLQCEEQPERILATLAQTKFSGFPLVTEKDHQVVGLILRSRLCEVVQEENVRADVSGHSTINLLQYADRAPEVKHWNTPLARAHRHFTAAGLSHLCIVDEVHRLLGILTRSDLAPLSNPRTRRKALSSLYRRKNSTIQADMLDPEGSKYMESSRTIDDDNLSEATSCASTGFAHVRGRGPRWAAY